MQPAASLTKTLLQAKERLQRLIKRIAKAIESEDGQPTPSRVIDLCSENSLTDYNWRGGYVFLYWAINEGPKWFRSLIKEEVKALPTNYINFLT